MKGMIVSVNVGFLNMAVFKLVVFLQIDMSRYFMAWSFSISAVKCVLGVQGVKIIQDLLYVGVVGVEF